jgi:hypothetical protein
LAAHKFFWGLRLFLLAARVFAPIPESPLQILCHDFVIWLIY